MESCLYTGQVEHQRLTPVANAFHYSLFFLYLVFRKTDFAEIKGTLASANIFYIFLMLCLVFPVVLVRSLRWKTMARDFRASATEN